MKALIVETEKIKSNIVKIREKAGGAEIIGVLKGNGYGLGLLPLARAIRDEGISRFAVTEPEDALKLRDGGFTEEEILILRSTAVQSEVQMIIESGATATIGSHDAAVALNGIAEKDNTIVDAHIEIDTGMGRYGFLPDETDRVISVFSYMKNINVTGMYTHFSTAFASQKTTSAQLDKLLYAVNRVREAGFNPGVVHAANSSALFKRGLPPLDCVRIGSAITGRIPAKGKFELLRVGYLEAPIVEIRWLPKKAPVGYGGAYTTKKPMKIAVVAAGYADGFMVEKSRDIFRLRDTARYIAGDCKKLFAGGRFYASIGGKRARILGHVGLNHTTVDVTEIECAAGDNAVLAVSPLYVGEQVERRYV